MEVVKPVKRNVLLNPGPATTSDAVKYAQVVPDICPREQEFVDIMTRVRKDLVKVVHGDPEVYTAVIFTGSGTIIQDVCVNSLVPEGKKLLVVNNGAYSARMVEIAEYYHIPCVDLKFPSTGLPDLDAVREALEKDPDIAVVATVHHETGTGVLNPVKEIGRMAHDHGCVFVVDTISTYGLRPIDIAEENIDFLMSSAQKGLAGMTGASWLVGRIDEIVKSKDYPRRSYYCNLFMQYDFFERVGEMHFTPPVQTIYALDQALKEYWEEGEQARWQRLTKCWEAIHRGLEEIGLGSVIDKADPGQAGGHGQGPRRRQIRLFQAPRLLLRAWVHHLSRQDVRPADLPPLQPRPDHGKGHRGLLRGGQGGVWGDGVSNSGRELRAEIKGS